MDIKLSALIALLLPTIVYASPGNMIGTFKGTSKTTVTECNNSNYNGVTSGKWKVTNTPLDGDSFEGRGSNENGDFTATGSVSGNQANGTTKGVNKWGQAWTGEFSGIIEGDKYTSTDKGHIPASGCRFVVEVEAQRQ